MADVGVAQTQKRRSGPGQSRLSALRLAASTCRYSPPPLLKRVVTVSLAVFTALGGPGDVYGGEPTVSIAVSGKVAPACTIRNGNGVADIGEIKPAGQLSASVFFTCNSNFHVSLASKNGGLANLGTQKAASPFTALLPYSVTLQLAGTNSSLQRTCGSAHMELCSVFGETLVATEQSATINLSWNLGTLAPLNGAYQDILTVTFSPGL
jgi:hypothetical protein